ncbi:hypothetical protein ACM66B_000319 [Microbotryomycetes sp. NB124-2]
MAPAVSVAIDGSSYITALAQYIKQHEHKLADFVNHKHRLVKPQASWTTVLTLGIVAHSSQTSTANNKQSPLVLRFDPHHLYYMLLKFDELGIPNLGPLDCTIAGGYSKPMTMHQHPDMPLNGLEQRRLFDSSDAMSFKSGFSSFSIGSGWWGTSSLQTDEATNVKYLYSSCTKLPALRMSPFTFPLPGSAPSTSSKSAALSKPVQGFEDCPPLDTAVPLYAFKNLSSLVLDDLDPRGFVGWDALSVQLRSLEVHNGAIEDVGELLCDNVVEDAELRQNGLQVLGRERKMRRQRGVLADDDVSDHGHEHERDAEALPPLYPVPPASAWSQLRHLSLSNNALTFVPSTPLTHLSVLTSLDLSSNLLISVPTGLDALHSLRSLNLSENMIDSLVGIHKVLGNVQVVNLSNNRLEHLSGLDRLFALERLDVRDNRVGEALEVSRLSSLPCLRELWIKGNPFTKDVRQGGESGYRVKCFNYFAKEGKFDLLLDGTLPGMAERRSIVQPNDDNGTGGGGGGSVRASSSRAADEAGSTSAGRRSASAYVPSTSLGSTAGRDVEAAVSAGRAKVVGRRRVVTTPHPPEAALPTTDSDTPASSSEQTATQPIVHKARHRRPAKRIVDLDAVDGPRQSLLAVGSNDDVLSDSSDGQKQRRGLIEDALRSSVVNDDNDNEGRLAPTMKSSSVGHSAAQTLSKRRDRVSASLFEGRASADLGERGGHVSSSGGEGEGGGLRDRIEKLRNEVGESWLSVLNEREAEQERRRNGAAAKQHEPQDQARQERQRDLVTAVESRGDDGVQTAASAATVSQEESQQPLSVGQDATVQTPTTIPSQAVKVVRKKRKGKKK